MFMNDNFSKDAHERSFYRKVLRPVPGTVPKYPRKISPGPGSTFILNNKISRAVPLPVPGLAPELFGSCTGETPLKPEQRISTLPERLV